LSSTRQANHHCVHHVGNSAGDPPQSSIRAAQVHLTAQNGDLMPERENLDLPSLVTAPEQDRELEEATEDEVEEGPQHK
jgi:hypothetical protein